MRVALRDLGVVPIGRNEECVDMRLARADRLLLHASDPRDRPVQLDLTGRGDLEPVVDVATSLFQHLKREREPRGRSADVAEVEADAQRKVDVDDLARDETDDGTSWIRCVRNRAD